MVKAKSNLFSEELTNSAALFKALAHPARIQILQYLASQKTCITGDISEVLPLGRTTVNQHIKELKEIGLIKGTIDGVKTKYCLNPCKIEEFKEVFDALYGSLENSCSTISCD
ncbi:ArsR/SmtB family transcription factor [Plebeiibacterium marinum]|uniref:Metalloregulator ArsR/SmtB family transcription factor n=1 Tax=Plebeiibacterium marinum TaxID=2992111 RepID=A0AAE3MET8_9BACT|nr:metalloregulator ArsR/SmtB family transcription factor [Plebeiobacterium marinum]MCW3806219.1 metalloregulator ArsR/SmtB family transcription factor [Plebeiobacterium marinum]